MQSICLTVWLDRMVLGSALVHVTIRKPCYTQPCPIVQVSRRAKPHQDHSMVQNTHKTNN